MQISRRSALVILDKMLRREEVEELKNPGVLKQLIDQGLVYKYYGKVYVTNRGEGIALRTAGASGKGL